MTVLPALFANLGLLALMAVLTFLVIAGTGWTGSTQWRSPLLGLILGGMAAVVVAFPLPGPLGATFDTRAAPIVLAGVIAGPAGGTIAAAIGAAARLGFGGPVAAGGAVSFFVYAATGMAFAAVLRRRNRDPLDLWALITLSLLATLAILPCFFIGQPVATGLTILQRFWQVLLLGNILSVVILGQFLRQMLTVSHARDRYRLEQETSRLARGAGGIGIWTFDHRTRELEIDPIARGLLGLDEATALNADVGFFRRLILPADRQLVDMEVMKARRTGGPVELRFRIRTPAGEVRHIRTATTFVGGTPEAPHLTIGAGVDETDEVHLQAEMRLRSAALDAAWDGILITEAQGDQPIVYANRRFLETTGYSEAEILGRNCRFLSEGLGEQTGLQELRQAIAGGHSCTVVLENRRRDGSRFWNSLSISPLYGKDGEVSHFIGALSDITEQISARLEAENTRDRLEAILVSAPDAILTVDEAQQVTSFNPAAEQLFGWPRQSILGRHIECLIPEDFRPRHRALADSYIGDAEAKPGSMTGMRIIRAKRRDGSSFPALVSLARFIQDGRPAVAATAHDMTAIVTANDRLTQLSLELSDQLKAAQDASEAKSQFLAHMSHELRTPLNAVLGFADLIRWTGPSEIGNEKLSGYIDDIHRSGAQLLDLINDVLDLAKIESDGLPIRMEPLDPQLLVDGAVETIRPIAEARNVALRINAGIGGHVRCDRRAMHQCPLNLLSNAVKFSPVGREVALSVDRRAGELRFSIRDQGPGMAPEMVAQIGQPFLRGTVSHLSSNSGGTGLGLAITKRLLDRQDARLEVESSPGIGSTFTIVVEATAARPDDQLIRAAGQLPAPAAEPPDRQAPLV